MHAISNSSVQSPSLTRRSAALDVFRGLTVALMILVNNPGSWFHIYWPFEHAEWHGLTPTDLVFPFFLFAVGNAAAVVLPRLREKGTSVYFSTVLKRSVLIFLIGFFLSWAPFFLWISDHLVLKTWEMPNAQGDLIGIRIFGILQRIAVCYGFAATIAYFFPKRIFSWSVGILILYWGLCLSLGSPHDPYSLEGWFGTAIDRNWLGALHIYHGEGVPFDPEGIMGSISGVAQVLLGYWAGAKLMATTPGENFSIKKFLTRFELQGLAFIAIGLICACFMPINKKIWTSTYVLVTHGLAMLCLGLLAWKLDFAKSSSSLAGGKNFLRIFFEAFGKNPLFIYVLSVFLPKMLSLIRIPTMKPYHSLTPFKWFYETICTLTPGPPENGSLVYAFVLVVFYGLIAIFLDRKKVYVRV